MSNENNESQAISNSINAINSAGSFSKKVLNKDGVKIPFKVKLIMVGVFLVLALLYILIAGTSSAQTDDVYHLTPNGEEESNRPIAEEEELSLSDRDFARKATENLLNIIADYKKADREAQIKAIEKECKENGWDIERSLKLLSDELEIVDAGIEYTSQDGRVLAAFSLSLDNGEIIKTGPLSYVNQHGIPVKTFIFGDKAGEINYEKSLKTELSDFIKNNHFYTLSYEMQGGQIKVYVDVEVSYSYEEQDILDSEGNPTGETETVRVTNYTYYYYVHPILTERDTNAMAEEIFGINPEDPYINSGYNDDTVGEGGVITNREAINRIAETTQALLFDVTASSSLYYFSSFSGEYEWPAPGNTAVTSTFGMRYHPITHKYSMHSGVDIGGSLGSPVVAAEAGTVIFTGYSGTYGNLIKVKHLDGNITYYAHLSAYAVSVGTEVERGQQLGLIGSTGQSTGPHLHFEVRINGTTIDPIPWITSGESY